MILTPEQPTLARHARNAAQSAHSELWRGLVGAWVPALGYQGARLYDLSMHRQNGVVPSALNKPLKHIEFDGTDNVLIENHPNLKNQTAPMVLAAWVRTTTTEEDAVVTLSDSTSGTNTYRNALKIRGGNGGVVRLAGDSSAGGFRSISGTTDVRDNKWHFIAGVAFADGTGEVWVDGVQEGSGNAYTWVNADRVTLGSLSFGTTPDWLQFYCGDLRMALVATNPSIASGVLHRDPIAPFRLRDDTALATAAMFGGTTTPSVTLPPPLFNMQMTGSF